MIILLKVAALCPCLLGRAKFVLKLIGIVTSKGQEYSKPGPSSRTVAESLHATTMVFDDAIGDC